jgi:hypothetical protein
MNTKHVFAAVAALALVTSACTDDVNDTDDPATGDEVYLDYGELIPGPDYERLEDPTYLAMMETEGGPQGPADEASAQLFEQGMDEWGREQWTVLPTLTADEFPELTTAERDAIISDYQGLVAFSELLRDDGSSDCLEVFATNPETGEPEWQPFCDESAGPDVKAAWAQRLVQSVAKPVGRWVVKKAAPAVANFARNQFNRAKNLSGAAVKYMRMQYPIIKMKALQAAGWVKQQAQMGYTYVKKHYKAALVAATVAAWGGFWKAAGGDMYNCVSQKLWGMTETSTTTTATALLVGVDGGGNTDVLFDIE